MFEFRDGHLFCEDVRVRDIVDQVGSPCYIYSKKIIEDRFQRFCSAFSDWNVRICYSVKANSNLSILKLLDNMGSGFDVVSGGEIFRLEKIGVNFSKVVYAGVGKTAKEIEYAIRAGIFAFNVESLPELELIDKIAVGLGIKARVCLRLNLDVDAKTHKYITTAKKGNKFGIEIELAEQILKNRKQFFGIDFVGIHIHLGSQIIDVSVFGRAAGILMDLLDRWNRDFGYKVEVLNFGGGLGIRYKGENPPGPIQLRKEIEPLVTHLSDVLLIFEPGRFIVGEAGILVTKVIYLKEGSSKKFVIVDAAMTELIRPSLYNAYHKISPIEQKDEAEMIVCDVVGPVCESGDFLGKGVEIKKVSSGDFLAVFSAGAYGMVMASNYNSRCRVAEILVDKDKFYVIRKRESFEDIISKEKIEDVV